VCVGGVIARTYRLFYAINEDEIVVVIVKSAHRKSAYQ